MTIRELLQDLVTKQALHAQEQEQMRGDIQQIKHVLLDGNGQPAMTVRVALVEQSLDRLKEERDDKKMPRVAWVGIIVSIILALVSIGATYS